MAKTPDQPRRKQEIPDESSTMEIQIRPPTRAELRNLWLKEYGEQDVALQLWVTLVEKENLEVAVLLQMNSLLIFGVMVSVRSFVQYHLELFEQTYRQEEPTLTDELTHYYTALIPPTDQPEIGPEGLPTMQRYVHLRDVTIISSEHVLKYPYWRGKLNAVDAFVLGATPGE